MEREELKSLEKRAEELDRKIYGEQQLPRIRAFNETAEKFNRSQGFSGNSLSVRGTYPSFRDLVRGAPEEAKLWMDWYEGKLSFDIALRELFGYGSSISIQPDPNLRERAYLLPLI